MIPNLLQSTIILFISNIIVRLLGFIYKIFLSHALGEHGLGIYHIVFNFLLICIALTTTGIPTTLSCLVSKNKALNNKHNTNILFVSTLYISICFSLFISFCVYIFKDFLSIKLLNSKDLHLFIVSICPAIIIVTLSNILRSYYYGARKVIIPAISQILEQISRISLVYIIIMFIDNKLLNCYVALIGISIGEIINTLIMLICIYKDDYLDNKFIINSKDFYSSSIEVFKLSLPLTCNKMSHILLQSFSSLMIPSRLVLSGFSTSQALNLYGVINGIVLPFIYLPFTLGSALVVNLIPSLSREVALHNTKLIHKKIHYSLVLTLFVGIISSSIIYFWGPDLCILLFNNSSAGIYLKCLYILPTFMCLNQTLSGILHALGKELYCSLNTILSMIFQIILFYFLLPIKSLNIFAYIYVSIGVSILTFILHSIVLFKSLKIYK